MIKLDKKTKDQLIELYNDNKICLEGNILKVIDSENDINFDNYLKEAIERDKENRKKRLDITKRIQSVNTDLNKWKIENERVNKELTKALKEAENSNMSMEFAKKEAEEALKETEKARQEAVFAKKEAEQAKNSAINDLEILQKKSQFEMIGDVVKATIKIIIGVGIITTLVFLISIFMGIKNDIIGSSWVNIMSILLTNSFSVIGTLMGVKTMSENKK